MSPSPITMSIPPTPTKSTAREACRSYPITLVTGGSGYIGSHTVLELLNAGIAVVVLDNLSNSHVESLNRVYAIAKHENARLAISQDARPIPPLFFHQVDMRHENKLKDIFAYWQGSRTVSLDPEQTPINIAETVGTRQYPMLSYSTNLEKRPKPLPSTIDPSRLGKITSVIHFAALKAVGESVVKPLEYYDVNIVGLLALLKTMKLHSVKEIVFSSSAVVYGRGNEQDITEDLVQVGGQGGGGGLLTNPYGRSKWMAEEILNDCCIGDPTFRAVALRYFNPTVGLLGFGGGCYTDGCIGAEFA